MYLAAAAVLFLEMTTWLLTRLRSRDVRSDPNDLDPVAAAERAIELAPDSPRRAKVLAEEIVLRAKLKGNVEALTVSERALGLAALGMRDGKGAVVHLRRAVSIAERAELPVRAAEARMSLGRALLYTGDSRGAFREIDAAGSALSGIAGARLQLQRAILLHHHHRLDEALDGYRSALAVFRRAWRPALGSARPEQPGPRPRVSRLARRRRGRPRRGRGDLLRPRSGPVPRRGRAQHRLGGGTARGRADGTRLLRPLAGAPPRAGRAARVRDERPVRAAAQRSARHRGTSSRRAGRLRARAGHDGAGDLRGTADAGRDSPRRRRLRDRPDRGRGGSDGIRTSAPIAVDGARPLRSSSCRVPRTRSVGRATKGCQTRSHCPGLGRLDRGSARRAPARCQDRARARRHRRRETSPRARPRRAARAGRPARPREVRERPARARRRKAPTRLRDAPGRRAPARRLPRRARRDRASRAGRRTARRARRARASAGARGRRAGARAGLAGGVPRRLPRPPARPAARQRGAGGRACRATAHRRRRPGGSDRRAGRARPPQAPGGTRGFRPAAHSPRAGWDPCRGRSTGSRRDGGSARRARSDRVPGGRGPAPRRQRVPRSDAAPRARGCRGSASGARRAPVRAAPAGTEQHCSGDTGRGLRGREPCGGQTGRIARPAPGRRNRRAVTGPRPYRRAARDAVVDRAEPDRAPVRRRAVRGCLGRSRGACRPCPAQACDGCGRARTAVRRPRSGRGRRRCTE